MRGLFIGVAAVAMLAMAGCANAPGVAAPATSAVPATTFQSVFTPPPCEVRVPSLVGMTGNEASAALASTEARDIRFTVNYAPMTNKVVSQSPPPGTCQDVTDPIELTLEAPPPPPHREISIRDWQLIAKSPDSHRGERIVIYGYVTQFDSATGPTVFRANVDAKAHSRTYDYETNTMLRGTPEQLANVVKDDKFSAEVTVGGSYSYETTMGGTLTVPVLDIDTIKVTG